MNRKLMCVLAVPVMFVASCGGGGGSSGGTAITVTISPSATDQTRGVPVTATLSGDITEPAGQTAWLTAFKLQKDGSGDNLCTAIGYTSKVATCTHADLTASSNYTVTISGLTDASGSLIDTTSATFTTAAPIAVSSFSKTSVLGTGEGEGTMSITATLESAIPDGVTPIITINSTEFDCTPATDRLSCTAEATGLSGCDMLQDYTATLSGSGLESSSFMFNSADDDFDDITTLTGDCYAAVHFEDCPDSTIAGGILSLVVPAAESCNFYKALPADFAVTLKTGTFSPGTTGDGIRSQSLSLRNITTAVSNYVSLGYGYYSTISAVKWAWLYKASLDVPPVAFAAGTAKSGTDTDGSLAPYKCLAIVNGKIYSYISDDGTSFIHLSTSNTEGVAGTTLPDTVDVPSTWTTLRADMEVDNSATNAGSLTGNFDSLKFKSSGLTGTSADCPTY